MVYVHININDMNFISSNNSTIHRVLKLHLLFSSSNQIIQDYMFKHGQEQMF